ncbi:zinc ribbon domain-containing protein [Lentibacillus juripiscarius]|uniref:Zinc ribbon domain-containing protein n=1 Tax=Lentibacillus juripiscarius TaxID=257446 RepID=A0ABW5V5C8_9BACI
MKKKTDAKQQVDELTSAKSKLLIELGQEVYLAYRREEQIAPIVEEKGRAIQELDAKLYALLKEKGEKKNEGPECSCGAPLAEDDLFCPECGRKVERMDEAEAETIICQSCANEVPADADFCHVCGIKMAKSRPDS